MPASYHFIHCDVFARTPYAGNSLAVFPDSKGLSAVQMLLMTQELRHFESVFLSREGDDFNVRIFDLFEELPFAGHPLLGAACALQRMTGSALPQTWTFRLRDQRVVSIETRLYGDGLVATIDQGRPDFVKTLSEGDRSAYAAAFNLGPDHLADFPLEVISTGLAYLVVPVRSGLERARIVCKDLNAMLKKVEASFAYLFDVERFEGRHWNNDGVVEDVATGSAAGVVGAYAVRHGLVQPERTFTLRQGRFLGRDSSIHVLVSGNAGDIDSIKVSGAVSFVGEGMLVAP